MTPHSVLQTYTETKRLQNSDRSCNIWGQQVGGNSGISISLLKSDGEKHSSLMLVFNVTSSCWQWFENQNSRVNSAAGYRLYLCCPIGWHVIQSLSWHVVQSYVLKISIFLIRCASQRFKGRFRMRSVNKTQQLLLCKHCFFLGTVRQMILCLCIYSTSEGHKFWAPDRPGVQICSLAHSICGPTAMNFLRITLLAPRILRWLQEFWKMCAPLQYRQKNMYFIHIYTLMYMAEWDNGKIWDRRVEEINRC
jgi:hypothetical protein